jgi:hypothetical protein
LRQRGYDPAAIYETNDQLKRVLDMIRTGYFSPEQPDLFVPIFDALVRHGDCSPITTPMYYARIESMPFSGIRGDGHAWRFLMWPVLVAFRLIG